jgi:AcrR family transcriptional regulator
MSNSTDKSTKARILDAAERAFADAGFEGASMRQIVHDAKVNLATVYYHFESKEGLMVAVLKRRFDPIKVHQLEVLRRDAEQAPGKPVDLEAILRALISPFLGWAKSPNSIEIRLLGRMMTEPNLQIQELLRSQYADVRSAFLEEFKRALPELPTVALLWRMEFAWGTLAALLCNPDKVRQRTEGQCDPANSSQLLAHFVPFLAAGFRIPAPQSSS